LEVKEESLVPRLIYPGPKFSLLEPRVSIPEFAEDYSSYFDSSIVISPIYSDQFKEENTSFQILPEVSYSPTLKYSSPYYYLANIRRYFPEAIKTLAEKSLEIFDNLHFESHIHLQNQAWLEISIKGVHRETHHHLLLPESLIK
jgi:hypothetical protein